MKQTVGRRKPCGGKLLQGGETIETISFRAASVEDVAAVVKNGSGRVLLIEERRTRSGRRGTTRRQRRPETAARTVLTTTCLLPVTEAIVAASATPRYWMKASELPLVGPFLNPCRPNGWAPKNQDKLSCKSDIKDNIMQYLDDGLLVAFEQNFAHSHVS